MKRRDFMLIFSGALAAWPLTAYGQQSAHYLAALEQAKRSHAKVSRPSEAARSAYITSLIRLREKAARSKTDEWKAIDAEIKRHPAPNDIGKILSDRLIGKWASPRHEYLYRADGTWTMLPLEEDATRGRWRIEGNQLFDSLATRPGTSQYTIILLTRKDLVFTDGEVVFYETRLR
jgi:hypothetical protein